jgi:hypothetical protein
MEDLEEGGKTLVRVLFEEPTMIMDQEYGNGKPSNIMKMIPLLWTNQSF